MRRVFSSLRILPVANIGRFYGGDDGDGGAGDGGNGSGNPGGSEQPVGLTEAATKQVNELINKALGSRFKAFEAQQTKNLEAFGSGLTEKLLGGIDEKLSAFKPAEPGSGKPKDSATDLSQHPDFRALKKQNDEFSRQLAEEREEKAKAKAAARQELLNRKIDEALQAAGFSAIKAARNNLLAEGRVRFEGDDSDNVVFVDDEGGGLPLKRGFSEFAKSAEGKIFMPATGANGSGDRQQQSGVRPGSQGNGQGQPPSKAELGQALLRLSQGG
jgi:hypothetical protein